VLVRNALAFLGAAVCLAACANIWGFQDLKEGDAAVEIPTDAPSPAEAGEAGDATEPADTSAGDDATLADDASSHKDASPARDAAHDASDASDANLVVDATAFQLCQKICGGCCDPSGTCVSQATTAACGKGGVACVDCTMTQSCVIAYAPCCGPTTSTCGCAAAGVLCPN
jgi:hypothetical protein